VGQKTQSGSDIAMHRWKKRFANHKGLVLEYVKNIKNSLTKS
jgi:hypothetical protein